MDFNFKNKEQIITEYLSNVDFSGDWSYNKMQNDLRQMIGEAPAINITYKKDVQMNEINSEAKEIQVVDKIEVLYSPNLDQNIKKLQFTIGA
jgi:phage gp37-like protein